MANIPEQLPQLHQFTWHDMPVSAMRLDIVAQCVDLVLAPYEEITATYACVEVSFAQVSNLEIQLSALANKSTGDDLEIYSLDVTEANENYQAELVLLTNYGPSSRVNFAFKSVRVT